MLKQLVSGILIVICLGIGAFAQESRNVELSGGFGYNSGDGGLSGLNAGGAIWFSPHIALAADYDLGWDVSTNQITQNNIFGITGTDNRMQNFLIGPRISLAGVLQNRMNVARFFPFAEIQLGGSSISSTLRVQDAPDQNSSDSAFTWLMGGGADVRIAPKWVGRFKVDLLRTHFASQGQSRIRIGMGVAYSFRDRH